MERSLISLRGTAAGAGDLAGRLVFVLGILASVVLSAVSGGVALAFSAFILPALHAMPDPEAVEVMQQATREVPASFVLVLLGTAVSPAVLVAADVIRRGWRACPWLAIGTVAYALGVVGATLGGTMPLNEWLHTLDSATLHSDAWLGYATADPRAHTPRAGREAHAVSS